MLPIPKIPELPDDNLYKFQGIVFIFLSLVLYGSIFFFEIYSNPEVKKSSSEMRGIDTELNLTHKKCKTLDSLVRKISIEKGFERYSDGFIEINDTVNFDKNSKIYFFTDSLENHRVNLLAKIDSLKIQKAKVQYYAKNSLNNSKSYFTIRIAIMFFCGLFLIIGIRGFFKWGRRSQRFQDIILMKQAGVDEEKVKRYLERLEKKDKRFKFFIHEEND
ncbi:MAG: hypothetical protein V4622_07515 [Bacteroidota bacterium]